MIFLVVYISSGAAFKPQVMQGAFLTNVAKKAKPTPHLGAETGNWNYEDMSAVQRSDAPVEDADDPARAAAARLEKNIGIFQPFVKFKLGNSVVFVVNNNDHEMQPLEKFMSPYVDLRDDSLRAGVWKVPYQIIATPDANVASGYTLQSSPADALSDEAKIVSEEVPIMALNNVVCAHHAVPDKDLCREEHFIFPFTDETFYGVGWKRLSSIVRSAESSDFDFAQRIQGLQGATQDAVWSFVDQAQLQRDRSTMLDKFFNGFLQKFLQNHPPSESNKPEHVVAEAVRMYEKMCEKWSVRHIRCVTAKIHAHCEALINFFRDVIPIMSKTDLTIKQWAYLVRRDPKLSPQFTVCLHYFMTKMEQDKGTRNANYKSMNHALASNMYAMQALRDLFVSHQMHIEILVRRVLTDTGESSLLHPLIIDWPDILSQINVYEEPFKGHAYHIGKEFGMGKTKPSSLFVPFT